MFKALQVRVGARPVALAVCELGCQIVGILAQWGGALEYPGLGLGFGFGLGTGLGL